VTLCVLAVTVIVLVRVELNVTVLFVQVAVL
jgi:hypothetical protein